MTDTLLETPLNDLHIELGGKMVPFAGYNMPVQYKAGILKEHNQCRDSAALFDVSHMGQIRLTGEGAAEALEKVVPGDIQGLAVGAQRYSFLLNQDGGIIDDLIITRREDDIFIVVNAARKDVDIPLITETVAGAADVEILSDRALIALQGPKAVDVLSRFAPEVADLVFMHGCFVTLEGEACYVTRSGYTGEDGYEISIPADKVTAFAKKLLAEEEVEASGLGARDSLRLEAGLCLYGHDIDEGTTPIEASLTWAISKNRRQPGAFPGADKILSQIADGAPRKRVGLRFEGRAPAREGAEIANEAGEVIGKITSGGFGPSVGAPVAMGYVPNGLHTAGTKLQVIVRGKSLPAEVVKMPFTQKRYSK